MTRGPKNVHIGGKTFRINRNVRTPQEKAEIEDAFAAFEEARAAIPEERRFHLSDRFGGHDFEGTEYEDWVNEQRQKNRQG
ncbi:hypothetical protein IRT45_32875 [Nocardia sp. BSTN01]|uniref:hypothetical protein n=1 Tax=Nocardia sp. BSTN01 TaxID=2783665 RepID=UPI00188E8960|nr:hypothetical protein [Nocardia sp. BSTN01]MBF5001916.1 hypothetical protein [Nocardia sp. BSTN01]